MSGKHEPGSSRSFYFSLATAGLRAALVVAAVVLGVFVLSKAFPTGEGSGAGPVTIPETQEPASPSPTPSPTETAVAPPQAPTCPETAGITVRVLNGTTTTGLAAANAEALEGLGYTVGPDNVGNAQRLRVRTEIVWDKGFKLAAQCLRDELYTDAKLMKNVEDNPDFDLNLILGEDVAGEAQ